MGIKNIIEIPHILKYMCFKQNFKGSVGRPMADRQKKSSC